MRILVTGGCGLIGKHLVKELLKDPSNHVDIVDNKSSSLDDFINEKNLSNNKVRFYSMNVEEILKNWFVKGDQYDLIYHLAAPVGPVGVLSHAGSIAQEILNDMYAVVNLSLVNDAKLMFISTSEVYGQNPVFDQAEDIDKIVPGKYTVRLEYGVAKLLGEIALSNIARVHPLKYFVVRPFNIVGPGQNANLGFVLPRFIQQALKGESITIYGDGSSKRTFTHVSDIVEAMVAIMSTSYYGTIFNIGNPSNIITIGELARMVKTITNSSSELIFVDPKTLHGDNFEEAWNKIPNISRAKSLLGWNPRYSLEEVIAETVEYERGNLE